MELLFWGKKRKCHLTTCTFLKLPLFPMTSAKDSFDHWSEKSAAKKMFNLFFALGNNTRTGSLKVSWIFFINQMVISVLQISKACSSSLTKNVHMHNWIDLLKWGLTRIKHDYEYELLHHFYLKAPLLFFGFGYFKIQIYEFYYKSVVVFNFLYENNFFGSFEWAHCVVKWSISTAVVVAINKKATQSSIVGNNCVSGATPISHGILRFLWLQ